ncbi:Protein CBG25027, partial [Caenorhabditis briggsae]
TNFKLRSRARHVFSEAHRVELFESACESKDIKQMGVLMNASHRSCAIDYECSCEELDAICELYTKHGALGARLTGAGWGGCAVVLMAADDVANIEKLPSLFVSKPGQGIRVHRF